MKQPLYQLVLLATLALSVPLQASQLVILQYHHVDSSTPPSTSLDPARFREHMAFLADNGFTVLRLEQALEALKSGGSLPDRAVSITFDDAYISVYEQAWPVMKDYDFPFTVFISAGLTGDTPGLYASWEQLREMGQEDATLANHTMSHPYLLERSPNESDSEWLAGVERQIVDAEQMIEAYTGQSHHMLVYPYGEYNPQIQALVAEMGFTGIGQQSGPVNATSDFTALPRFPFSGIYASMKTFAERVSTLAFNVESVQPESPVTTSGNPEAKLTLAPGDYRLGAVSCFHNNTPMRVEIAGRTLTINSSTSSTSRRFRYNCTAPGADGRFYWYSVDWVNPSVEE